MGEKTPSPRWFQRGPERALLSLQMFKGPNQDIDAIYTAPSSAVCGVSLEATGKEYLITGGSSPHAPVLTPSSAVSPHL